MTFDSFANKNDKTKWKVLYTMLKSAHRQDGKYPLVSLETFFEGNRDLGSIGCNLSNHPGIETFYRILRDIRSRNDVQDVMIGITDINEYETDELTEQMADWPFSDSVYVVTTASASDIESLVTSLQPSEVEVVSEMYAPHDPPIPESGYHVVQLWWD